MRRTCQTCETVVRVRETSKHRSATSTARYCTVQGSYNTNVHRGTLVEQPRASINSSFAATRRPAQQWLQLIRSVGLLHWPTRTRFVPSSQRTEQKTLGRAPPDDLNRSRVEVGSRLIQRGKVDHRGGEMGHAIGPRDTGSNSKRGDSSHGSHVIRLRILGRVLGMCSIVRFVLGQYGGCVCHLGCSRYKISDFSRKNYFIVSNRISVTLICDLK